MSDSTASHDYHMVGPSRWPIMGGFSTLLLAVGLILFMHDYTPWILPLGFLAVAYTMMVWWRDVIQEATFDGSHTPVVQIGMRYGMATAIVVWMIPETASAAQMITEIWLLPYDYPVTVSLITISMLVFGTILCFAPKPPLPKKSTQAT